MAKKRGEIRRRSKFPGIDKRVNAKTRHDVLDFDYLHKLSDKEKEWLSNVMDEYVSGNFNHPGKIFHKSGKSKRECYSRNNSRNRDVMTISNATGRMVYSPGGDLIQAMMDKDLATHANSVEDTLINVIDLVNAGATTEMIEMLQEEPLKKKANKLNKRSNSRRTKNKLKGSNDLVLKRRKVRNRRS